MKDKQTQILLEAIKTIVRRAKSKDKALKDISEYKAKAKRSPSKPLTANWGAGRETPPPHWLLLL